MTRSAAPPSGTRAHEPLPVALLGALFVVMLSVRPQLLAIGPLLPEIQHDLGISHTEASLLSTIPVVCMGAFAPFGPRLAGRLGPRLAIAACVALIGAFSILRVVVPGAPLVIALTVGIGLGMGLVGALPAVVVKQRMPGIPGLGTGAYSLGLITGSAIAAAFAVPLSLALGGWRPALLALALATFVPLVAWLLTVPRDARRLAGAPAPPRLPWRWPTAWLLMFVFGLQAMLYYGVISWLPDAYVERGWSEADAGNLIAVLHVIGLAVGFAIPWLADRYGTRRAQLTLVSAICAVGLLGVVLVPDLAWLWAAVLGVGLGAIFPLVLILPIDVANDAGSAGAAAAMMLMGGYIFSGTGPLILGAARDLTGDFSTSLWLLVGLAVVLIVCAAALSPARLLSRRHAMPVEGALP